MAHAGDRGCFSVGGCVVANGCVNITMNTRVRCETRRRFQVKRCIRMCCVNGVVKCCEQHRYTKVCTWIIWHFPPPIGSIAMNPVCDPSVGPHQAQEVNLHRNRLEVKASLNRLGTRIFLQAPDKSTVTWIAPAACAPSSSEALKGR